MTDRCRSPGVCNCPDMPRCPRCGYTEHDARYHMDHYLCEGIIPGCACSKCDGSGEISTYSSDPASSAERCFACDGTGERAMNGDATEIGHEHGVRRLKETIAVLHSLIADLSVMLTDEPADLTSEYIIDIRRRVANALPRDKCPDWLLKYQYAPMVQS